MTSFVDGDGVRQVQFRTWIRDTKSSPGDGTAGTIEDIWHAVDIKIPWERAKHYCCWQQTWGVGLPESAVDWSVVNSWRGHDVGSWGLPYAPSADSTEVNFFWLGQAIKQSVDLDYWTRNQASVPRQGATNITDAPAGYSCGMFLYPGPGCDSSEDSMTSSSDAIFGHVAEDVQGGYDVASDGMMGHAEEWLTGYDDMLSSIASTMTFGVTGPLVSGLDSMGDQILDAREAAASAADDVWTFKWRTGIFSTKPVEIKLLDLIPGKEGSLLGPSLIPWIKRIIEIICYLLFARALLGLFLPKTVLPGGGSSNDE